MKQGKQGENVKSRKKVKKQKLEKNETNKAQHLKKRNLVSYINFPKKSKLSLQ